MRFLLIIGILFNSVSVFADISKERYTIINDSLQALLKLSNSTDERNAIYVELAENHTGNNDSLAIIFVNKLIQSNPPASIFQKAKAYYFDALINIYASEHSKAIPKLEKAISYYLKIEDVSKTELGNCYLNIARSNRFAGHYFKAIKNLSIALEYFEESNDKKGIANCTNHIGIVYNTINNNEKAKEYYLKCQPLYKELNDNKGLVYLLNNLGYIEQESHNYHNAIKYYNDGLELAKSIEFDLMESHLLSNLAHLYVSQHDFDKAEEFIKKGLILSKEISAHRLYQFFKLHQIQLEISRDKSTESQDELGNIIQYAKERKLKFLETECLKVQKELYLLKGEYKKAYNLSEYLYLQKDSLNSSNLAKETAFLDSKYKHESSLISEKLSTQKDSFSKKLTYATGLFSLLMMSMALCFVNRVKKKNLTLNNQYKLLTQKDNDLKLSSKELEIRNDKLKLYIKSNTQLEKFARATSHDIKTPLRTIASFAGLLEKSIKPNLGDKEQEYLNHIIQGTKRLGGITNDLLNYSSVNGNSLNVESFDFKKMIENNLKDLAFIIQQTNTQVKIGALPAVINADRIKIRRVMQNLIENGIKYCCPETSPVIEIHCEEKESFFEFIVSDNGIGIKEEDYDKVFKTFSRVDELAPSQGVGLGLSICKNNIEKHGGKIWINPDYKDGAEFRFTIPKKY